MALEDDFCDIVKKARLGQGLSVERLADVCGMVADRVSELERGQRPPSPAEAKELGAGLGLEPESLLAIGLGQWHPQPYACPQGVEMILGDIGGYAVKGYVLHDGGEAICIDTAYNADAMLHTLDRLGVRLKAMCLTHGHADHADGLDRMLARWPVPVYLGPEDDALLSWRPRKELRLVPRDGMTIQVGRYTVRFLTTPGHTPGGTCYAVEGEIAPFCFVGDTLFAGSIGRSNPFHLYSTHLRSVRERLLTLPPETHLFPGHGPATSVGEERHHNPFAGTAQ